MKDSLFLLTCEYKHTLRKSPFSCAGIRILPLYSIAGNNDMHITTQVISVTIPKELLEKVDEKRSDIPRSRFIVRALESKLQDLN